MADKYGFQDDVTYPSKTFRIITASASPLDPPPKALIILSDGNITLLDHEDVSTGSVPVKAGMVLGVRPKAMTAATAIVLAAY